MAAKVIQSDVVKARIPAMTGSAAGQVVPISGLFALTAPLELGDVLEACMLPPGYAVVDVIVDADDLDVGGSPALTFDAGVIAGDPYDTAVGNRAVGQEFLVASTVGQAGGVVHANRAGATRVPVAASAERMVGLRVSAAPATGAAGQLRFTLLTRPAVDGK